MGVGLILPEPDRRGKHNRRPWKVSEVLYQRIREHMSFLRGKAIILGMVIREDYLSTELSIARMYQTVLAD